MKPGQKRPCKALGRLYFEWKAICPSCPYIALLEGTRPRNSSSRRSYEAISINEFSVLIAAHIRFLIDPIRMDYQQELYLLSLFAQFQSLITHLIFIYYTTPQNCAYKSVESDCVWILNHGNEHDRPPALIVHFVTTLSPHLIFNLCTSP